MDHKVPIRPETSFKMNSAMESIYHGVPMIVIPQMPEQANAA